MNTLGHRVADKRAFLADHRFTIAFENESHSGYTTEKVVEPMLVNSIPIYWGDPLIGRDFDTRSFLSAHDCSSRATSALLDELGRRKVTNLLVEGGSALLASCFSHGQVDEVWAVVAPQLIGGPASLAAFVDAPAIDVEDVSHPGGDVLVRGLMRPAHPHDA